MMPFPANRFRLAVPILIALFGVAACSPPQKPDSKKSGTARETSGGTGEKAVPENRREFSADDREKLAEFGKAYARAVTGGDDAFTKAAWNVEVMLKTALGDSGSTVPEVVQGMKRGFKDSLGQKPGGMMWATFKKPWRMLRVHEVDGETRILCRLATDGGLNYIDLIPQLNAVGDPEIVDAYAFSTGEKFSDTIRRLLLPQIANAAKTSIEKLLTTPDPLVKYGDEFLTYSKTYQSGDFGKTIEKFGALPPEIQENKAALLLYLDAASKLMTDDENPEAEKAYRDGVNRFQETYGDDPAFLLMGIDYYFFQEDFDAASEAVDKLDKAVGGDPYLDFYRASMLLSQEKYEEALPLAQRALENDPDIEDPYWGIVNIQLALGNFEAVAAGLDQLVERFGYELELDKDPAYGEFRLSPVGKAWIEKHEAGN